MATLNDKLDNYLQVCEAFLYAKLLNYLSRN